MAASEEAESRISDDPTPELRDLERHQIIKELIQATGAVKVDSATWAFALAGGLDKAKEMAAEV
jgi:hypothetical protein